MKTSKFVDRDSRRNALKGMAALGGAAVLSASANASTAETNTIEEKQFAPESLGYRETAHVREYYRLARF